MESFHKALSLRRDDAFSTNMLNNVVEHLVDDITPFQGKSQATQTDFNPPLIVKIKPK